ncbi:hypothetical protein [Thermophilibacter sp.]|uniref:hypothetical protein n=1 Tax=Thermophilibacter sp. TaxID=2847309 RepID=UPI003A8D06B5
MPSQPDAGTDAAATTPTTQEGSDVGVFNFDTASAYGNEEEVGRIDVLDRGEKHDWY